jgi:2-isopropylmalate synthase
MFDSTLRDGAQGEGISFSLEDKLKILTRLDAFGVDFVEAGNPGSNPKDLEFFKRAETLGLKTKLVAFGSTKRSKIAPEDDDNLNALLTANTQHIAIFGKSWDMHVEKILRVPLEENLEMIERTISYLVKLGKSVMFDAEHFFDGYAKNPEYALSALEAAAFAGADWLVLCDTNGGAMPMDIFEITKRVLPLFKLPIGIHCHNDCGMAVANSIMAVLAGAVQVQGTFFGFGERCGNASLSAVIPNLMLKMGVSCIGNDKLPMLTGTARYLAEVANISINDREPYIGNAAFAHKGGMHGDGVFKAAKSFEHIDPAEVGNERRMLVSEYAGRSVILPALQFIDPSLKRDSEETARILKKLKEMEHEGYHFEGAEASLSIIIRKQLGRYKPFFELVSLKIMGEQPYSEGESASALIKVKVDGRTEITAAEGAGPVNALDKALRKALEVFYPQLSAVHLTDYKVRVNGGSATASKVRVLIESGDGAHRWTTVGVSGDIIEASWIALVDSIEYKLIRDIEDKFKAYM